MTKAFLAICVILLIGAGLDARQPLPISTPADAPNVPTPETIPTVPRLAGPPQTEQSAPTREKPGQPELLKAPAPAPDRVVGGSLAGLGLGQGPESAHEGHPLAFGEMPGVLHSKEPLPGSYGTWAGVEALYLWEKKQPFPLDLVTIGSPTDPRPGSLGQPNTQVVFGPSDVNYGGFIGLRTFAGMWFDANQVIGMEASGFLMEGRNNVFALRSNLAGGPVVALRHLDPPGGAEDAFVFSAPTIRGTTVGLLTGAVLVKTDSQLWGSEANLLHTLYWSRDFHLVALAGLRYLDLNENVLILTQKAGRGTTPVSFVGRNFPPSAFDFTTDWFHDHDQFYGGQLGLRGDYFFNQFFVGISATLAMGQTNQGSNILGLSTVQIKGINVLSVAGGLYALSSNSGRFNIHDFGIIPEMQVKGGMLITSWLRATVGYDFLYWNRVLRPGDQLDLNVSTAQVPTSSAFKSGAAASLPPPVANQSSFWAQGITFALEFTF